jgi:predicted GNAT family acetyltransferase
MDDIAFTDNAAAHRFELLKAGVVAAYSEYNLLKDSVMFTHTEVLPQYESQGLGSMIAKFALDDVRRRGLLVIPVCPFVASFIHRHVEYQALVTEQNRRAFKS